MIIAIVTMQIMYARSYAVHKKLFYFLPESLKA